MSKRVLVTGFQPFLEFKSNPSSKIASSLDGTSEGSIEFIGRTLPVAYDETENVLIECISDTSPDIVIGTGLSPGRSKMSIEKIAANYKNASEPDNKGNIVRGVRIDESQPDGIFSRLSVEKLVDYLQEKGIPTELSMTAGAYLCNYAMFVIVRETSQLGIPGGFVHIPCDYELATSIKGKSLPSLGIETMISGIKAIALYELEHELEKNAVQ